MQLQDLQQRWEIAEELDARKVVSSSIFFSTFQSNLSSDT
jgi:hypothetical protein